MRVPPRGSSQPMLRYVLRPANLFTASSLYCGLYSIMLSAGAAPGEIDVFFRAAVFIIVAGLFDMLDGPVARLTRTQSDFGVQFDSLADVVAFGVAPGVLLYKWGLDAYGTAGFVVAFLFTLGGALRLARFNVQTGASDPRFSSGLTITTAGMTVASLVVHHHKVAPREVENHLLVLVFTLLLSYLMVSNVRFRTTKWFKPTLPVMAGFATFVFGTLAAALFFHATMVLILVAGAYIGSGLVEEILRLTGLARRRFGFPGSGFLARGMNEDDFDDDE